MCSLHTSGYQTKRPILAGCWILLIWISLSTNCFGQTSPTGYPALSHRAGIVWMDAVSHDFGTIPAGRPVEKSFRFRNAAAVPVRIDNIRTTCGCTNSLWSEKPVPTGEMGSVTVIYDAAVTGPFRKKISVWFAGVSKPARLYVQGRVK